MATDTNEFNNHHPELQEDEVFLLNCVQNTPSLLFESLPFKTRRLGDVAYDNQETILKKSKPVFVRKDDLHKYIC